MPSQDPADKSALDDTMSTDGISFLPPGSSALGCCKWSYLILEGLSRRVGECVLWGEESADVVRIAVGGIRERIVKAALVCWREGTLTSVLDLFSVRHLTSFSSFPLNFMSCSFLVTLLRIEVLHLKYMLWLRIILFQC